MRQLALLIAITACKSTTDDYPVVPPDPTPDPTLVDARPTTTDGVVVDGVSSDAVDGISGRVCVLADARAQTTCKATGAGGLTVTIGTESATTAADGTFTIATPTGTNLVWHVKNASFITSVMPFGSSNQIPALSMADYVDLESNNAASVQSADQGEIFARVVRAGAPLANAKATSTPVSAYGPFYDGSSAVAWNFGANEGTGAAGVAWFPGIGIGNATVSITPSGGTATIVSGVPVESQAITWIVVGVP